MYGGPAFGGKMQSAKLKNIFEKPILSK